LAEELLIFQSEVLKLELVLVLLLQVALFDQLEAEFEKVLRVDLLN
jgi:hypothetical protein